MRKLKDELNDLRSHLVDRLDGVRDEVAATNRTSQAMADAMMKAIKQLGIDKANEARVARLEATVHGDKH